jgi:hypothetical protein
MRTWIYALCNAIESCINGTSTLRSSDFRVLQQSADFAEPRRKKSPIPFSSAPARHSFPANPSHTRRTSLKDRFMSDLLPSGKSSTSPSPDGRPDFLTKGGRMPSNASSSHSHSQSQSQSQSETDAENAPHQPRRRSPLPPPPLPADPNSPNPAIPTYDMQMLRVVADSPANSVCADCGRRTKSSRWATVSLREMPMVMFLCIRCCGVVSSRSESTFVGWLLIF